MIRKADRHTGRPLRRIAVYSALLVLLSAGVWYYRHLLARSLCRYDARVCSVDTGALSEQPLYNILRDNGITEPQLSAISAKLATVIDPQDLRRGDAYFVSVSTTGVFLRLVVTHGLTRYYVAGIKNGRLKAGTINIPVLERRVEIAGKIKSSLWESMTSRGLSPQVVMGFADIFAWNIDFLTETRDGDRYAVVFDEKYTADGDVLEQKLLGAYYDGHNTGFRKAFAQDGDYYSQNGEALHRMFLRAPLVYRRISSYFTKRRYHPILRIFRPHLGIDYAAPSGTPVSSVARGRVVFMGRKGGFGNFMEIRHDDNYTSSYGHLSAFARGVRKGSQVKQGDVVAYVGSTGLSSGPHLDFRIRQGKQFINFLTIKNRSAGALKGSALASLRKKVAALTPVLDKKISGI